ncbi:MAG: hypothetical protein K1W05_01510, partial [Desulfovibrio sp.]
EIIQGIIVKCALHSFRRLGTIFDTSQFCKIFNKENFTGRPNFLKNRHLWAKILNWPAYCLTLLLF